MTPRVQNEFRDIVRFPTDHFPSKKSSIWALTTDLTSSSSYSISSSRMSAWVREETYDEGYPADPYGADATAHSASKDRITLSLDLNPKHRPAVHSDNLEFEPVE